MAGLGVLLTVIGMSGMDDIPNRPTATAYILVGLTLVVIGYLVEKKKSLATNRPK